MGVSNKYIARFMPAFGETPAGHSLPFSLSTNRDPARSQPPIILSLRGVKVNLFFWEVCIEIFMMCACFVRALVVYKNKKISDVLMRYVCLLCQGFRALGHSQCRHYHGV